MAYSGKDFEVDLQESLKESGFKENFVRLYDQTGGKLGVSNPCDFVYYYDGNMVLLELKTTKEASFPISMIRDNQFTRMLERKNTEGILAGFLLYMRHEEKECLVYFDIGVVEQFKDEGLKSIPFKSFTKYGVRIPYRKKRVHIDIDIESMLRKIKDYSQLRGAL